jgi:hypothetical protein
MSKRIPHGFLLELGLIRSTYLIVPEVNCLYGVSLSHVVVLEGGILHSTYSHCRYNHV